MSRDDTATHANIMKLTVALLIFLSVVSCTRLTPQEREHYASRLYALPQERVFEAVKERVAEYPMGLGTVDPSRGIIKSGYGGTTPMMGATVGYRITVRVSSEGQQTRVSPAWEMNISSEPTKPHLLPLPIDERPQLYMEFFDELDAQLTKQE